MSWWWYSKSNLNAFFNFNEAKILQPSVKAVLFCVEKKTKHFTFLGFRYGWSKISQGGSLAPGSAKSSNEFDNRRYISVSLPPLSVPTIQSALIEWQSNSFRSLPPPKPVCTPLIIAHAHVQRGSTSVREYPYLAKMRIYSVKLTRWQWPFLVVVWISEW